MPTLEPPLTDLDIAHAATPAPIATVAAKLGLTEADLYPYGRFIAKVESPERPLRGRLVLVTALTPTPLGEGKTTITIGLTQALGRLGVNAAAALREPSLGPVFGQKGGATGGGRAQVLPMEDINLHFTGDFHAVTSAVNLLAAMADNHLQQGNALGLDPRRLEVKRVLDVNDRALRHVNIGLGGPSNGVPRETGFDITVASEVMAIMALARDLKDLRERLGRMRVGLTYERRVVTAAQLGAQGAMTALLAQALKPNLVQTLEGQPAFVHMGPFANIAHGANSIVATRQALGLADFVITEAGFGADLGAEKFFNVVCPAGGFEPQAVVLVATLRALKHHGNAEDPKQPDPEAVRRGLANLDAHVGIIQRHGFTPIVALNAFSADTPEEEDTLRAFCIERNLPYARADVWARGGEGGEDLARVVLELAGHSGSLKRLYEPANLTLEEKIERIATQVYGADGVDYQPAARTGLAAARRDGAAGLPVVMAKTPASLSDNAKLAGRPSGFRVTVTDVSIRAGAGFVVARMGDIMTMPGLPKAPAANKIDVTETGEIIGLS